MRTVRTLLVSILTACAALVWVAPALAATSTPPATPISVVSEGFESTSSATYPIIQPLNITFDSTAWWGQTALVRHGGSKSLWCAAAPAAPAIWPAQYPQGSGGTATFAAPGLSGYYSATLSFAYTMPSLGDDDSNAFNVGWYDSSGPPWLGTYHYGRTEFPTGSAWATKSFVLPPRTGENVVFQWYDGAEDVGQKNWTGTGPAIDDVYLRGYTYGPVRSLAVTRVAGGAHVAWQAPYRALDSTTLEERPLTYRVWRSPTTAPSSWIELTSTRIAATSLDDTTVALGGSYCYFVQAWDLGTGTGYGAGDPSRDIAVLAAGSSDVSRVQGPTRIDTAISAAEAGFPGGADSVVVANSQDWPDAMIGSALAGAVHGPLLIVNPSWSATVAPVVAAEIEHLRAKNVYVVGDTTGIPSYTYAGLGAVPGVTHIERVPPGASTAEKCKALAVRVKELRGGTTGGTVFVATDMKFPDALSASSLVAALKAPILLTPQTALPQALKDALTTLGPDAIVVCGSNLVVSDAIEAELQPYAPSVIRKGGTARYDTARALVEYGVSVLAPSGPAGIYLATGENYPDALSGGVLAGIGGGTWRPLMITLPGSLSTQASGFMDANHTIGFARVMGSNLAVGDNVLADVGAHLY